MFRKRLHETMFERKITQKELAEATGLSKSGISQYVSGKFVPNEKAMQKLADALEVSVEYLSGVEKPPPKPQEPPDVRRVTIAEAADRMGKSQQFVRVLLQSGKADFGFAVKGSAGTYSYHISPKKFSEYIGDAPGAGGLVFDH